MTESNFNILCTKVDEALNQLNPDKFQKTSQNDWKYTTQAVDAQIVVTDVLQNDSPYLILYFKVIELKETQKLIALEELMKSNMQLSTKYGLMENRIIQAAEIIQTDQLSSDSILLMISTYITHVANVRYGLNQLFKEKA